jgi:succinate-acetate transporter protein
MARDVDAGDAVAPATPVVADPAPLGLAGFALTTVLLSAFNAGLINNGKVAPGSLIFVGMALAYGGLGQFMAGMWEFRNRNTFGATAFSSFGAFWIGVGALFVFDVVGRPVVAFWAGDGVIWFLFCWAVFTTYMWVASFRVSGAVMLVFLLLALTFWALWIGALQGTGGAPGKGFTQIGGYLGLATAIVAFYTSFAGVVNSTFGRVIAPVYPLNQPLLTARGPRRP